MSGAPSLVWQPTLFDTAEPSVDEGFCGLRHCHLDLRSWVDHVPGWLSSSDRVFADLLARIEWRQQTMWMYARRVVQPRLTHWWELASGTSPPHPILGRMLDVLSARYGVRFDSIGLNLYRDGSDGVAWHGDRIAREIVDPLVAIVSVGHPRKLLLRPAPAGRSTGFVLGRGDLLVMGGACQREWQHTIAKVASAGPRISITFRHSS